MCTSILFSSSLASHNLYSFSIYPFLHWIAWAIASPSSVPHSSPPLTTPPLHLPQLTNTRYIVIFKQKSRIIVSLVVSRMLMLLLCVNHFMLEQVFHNNRNILQCLVSEWFSIVTTACQVGQVLHGFSMCYDVSNCVVLGRLFHSYHTVK